MIADDFIKLFLPIALKIEEETGFNHLVMLTQSALETGWGTKVKSNNYFGIKGKSVLIRTREVLDNPNAKFQTIFSITPIKVKEKIKYEYDVLDWFEGYETPIDSFRRYVDFLKSNKRYNKALAETEPDKILIEIAKAGYATGLNYKDSLLSVLKSVQKRLKYED